MHFRELFTRWLARLRHPASYRLTEALFLRLLGLIYLSAFASLWPQILGLVGSRGIAPVARLLAEMRATFGPRAFQYSPSLFWLDASDRALVTACALGCLFSLLLAAGVLQRLSTALCFVLYLSLSSVGQPFTSFQWDALLLETGFLALFAGAPWLVWAYRLLVFRLMFESFAVKLVSHDPNWRNLHALRFHFFTQPLPNPLAYYMFRAPPWLLDGLTAATLAIECLAPFLLFAPRRARHAGVVLLIALQVGILLTGNYAFFNYLSIVLCLWAWDDAAFTPLERVLRWKFPRLPPLARTHALTLAGNTAVAILTLFGSLQLFDSLNPDARRTPAKPLLFLSQFQIVNGYGLFAVMTTTRPEIVLEGSDDAANWREYSFPYKPGNTHRSLPVVAPYQPRLDWQMWFAALGTYNQNAWVGGLIYRLLTGEPSVIGLLNPPPFAHPPRYIRALLYDYEFTTLAERARTGAVWQRHLRGTWFGPVSLTGR